MREREAFAVLCYFAAAVSAVWGIIGFAVRYVNRKQANRDGEGEP